ncbi:MAG: sensor domain-containing diguanylate cyclase, partial [Dehalococcoidales bacterium]|nr:sensor domain-containing diguanylate cyclase [Dehalococcoidales bacterium]
ILNIQDVYDTFIGELRQTVNIDFAAIGLLDDEKINFTAVYNKGTLPWHAGDKFDIRGSGLEWIVIGKKSLIYPDYQIDPNSTFIGQLARIGIRSAVFLPLITKDEVIGILSLASFRINAYTHEQVQFLEQLASQVATSVVNAELYSKAEKRARIDELTQLSNRRHFDEMIDKEIHRHFRYGNQLSLILMDLDNFKSYNDLMGHVNGDKLLKKIGQIILESIRNVDLAFRYGGDEFAVILPNTPVEDGQNIAERIRINIEHAMSSDNVLVTASIGLAGWPNDGITTQEIITAADQALYHAKRTGQNRICLAAQLLPSPVENTGHIQPLEKETLNTIYALASIVAAR